MALLNRSQLRLWLVDQWKIGQVAGARTSGMRFCRRGIHSHLLFYASIEGLYDFITSMKFLGQVGQCTARGVVQYGG